METNKKKNKETENYQIKTNYETVQGGRRKKHETPKISITITTT